MPPKSATAAFCRGQQGHISTGASDLECKIRMFNYVVFGAPSLGQAIARRANPESEGLPKY